MNIGADVKMDILAWPIVIVAGFLMIARSTGIARVLMLIIVAILFIFTALSFFSDAANAANMIELFKFTIIALSIFIIANSLIRRSKNKLDIFIIICAAISLLVPFAIRLAINAFYNSVGWM